MNVTRVRRKRACLVYPHPASFIETDRRILSEAFEVAPFLYSGRRDIWRLARAIRTSDLTISWFALGHATVAVYLSRLFGRPSVVIAGGWDVASVPEIPYGAMLSPRRRRLTTRTLRRADLLLAVSRANREEVSQWTQREIRVVPLGVDTRFFTPAGPKENLVVTVASVTHEGVIRTKGIDIFLEVARRLPEISFVLAGDHEPAMASRLRASAPGNVTIEGWLERDAIRTLFRRAKVYAQLSAHESFGLALAEAMACECYPVASDRGSLPEIVGPAGALVPYGDAGAAAAAIATAVREPRHPAARGRIETEYPLELRRTRMLELLKALP